MTNGDSCLTVVMPCFNEEATIIECTTKVLESRHVGELIIVDDGSTDKTRSLLATMSDPRVKILLQDVNQGKGAALARGFKAATLPYVIVQDADLEYDPAEFTKLLQPLLDDAEHNRFIIDLDAISASQILHIPTLNGYSGFIPFGYENVTTCEDLDGMFAEILRLKPDANLARIALIGGECG